MTPTILFVCPHHAAKSIIAEAYFNRLAQQRQIAFVADSAGTEPGTAVSPVVAKMLLSEGIDVSGRRPRRVTKDDLMAAYRIVSMGCTPEELGTAPERVEQWPDVPMVSQGLYAVRESIRVHVEMLVAELQSQTTEYPRHEPLIPSYMSAALRDSLR